MSNRFQDTVMVEDHISRVSRAAGRTAAEKKKGSKMIRRIIFGVAFVAFVVLAGKSHLATRDKADADFAKQVRASMPIK